MPIAFEFMGVEPVILADALIIKMNNANHISKLQPDRNNKEPKWLADVKKIYPAYSGLESVFYKRYDGDDERLAALSDYFTDQGLPELFSLGAAEVFTIFDRRTGNFMLVYSLRFRAMEAELFLNGGPEEYHKHNIYSIVRSALTRNDDDSLLPEWTMSIHGEVRQKVRESIKAAYAFDSSEDDVFFANNICNITNFTLINQEPVDTLKAVSNTLIDLNNKAERITATHEPRPIGQDDGFFYFAGRHHTITSNCPKILANFKLIQYQAQMSYTFLFRFNEIMCGYTDDLLLGQVTEKQGDELARLISKIDWFALYFENTKVAMEGLNESFFSIADKRWNISGLLGNLKSYAHSLHEFLQREYAKKSSGRLKRQGTILFIISLLQIAMIISAAESYFNVASEEFIGKCVAFMGIDVVHASDLILMIELFPIIVLLLMLMALFWFIRDGRSR